MRTLAPLVLGPLTWGLEREKLKILVITGLFHVQFIWDKERKQEFPEQLLQVLSVLTWVTKLIHQGGISKPKFLEEEIKSQQS